MMHAVRFSLFFLSALKSRIKGSLLLLLFAACLGKPGYGQQNLFNIPSGDITPTKKMFYQHQFNAYNDKLESKAHFIYGLGSGWDAGINLVGKGFYFAPEWRVLHNDNPQKGALYPVLMGSIQKQVVVSKSLDVNIGAQVGHNLSRRIQNKEVNYFTYAIGIYHFMHQQSRLVGGIYKTNQMYVGEGNTFGAMLGFELKLTNRWYLMGDWVSGRNDASVAVIGGMYQISKRIQLCAGWQIPNPNTPKPMGLVLELNILGYDQHEH